MKTTPIYSLYILHDNNTWEQPSFQIVSQEALTEHEIRMIAENHFGGFISYGLQEDSDCDAELVQTIQFQQKISSRTCSRCGSRLNHQEMCTDITCPFEKHQQHCGKGWVGHPEFKARAEESCSCDPLPQK